MRKILTIQNQISFYSVYYLSLIDPFYNFVDNILLDEANKYLKQSWAGEPGWGVKKDAV